MDNTPVKKKKKYVRKVVQGENSESSEAGNANSSTNASQLDKFPFYYSFDEIVNHILAKIIPNNQFEVDLTNGLIIGNARQIEEIRKRLVDNIKYYTGFIIELEKGIEREDIQYEFQEPFDASLFGPAIIEKIIAEIFIGTKYEEDCNSFLKMFKSQSERFFVRMIRKHEQQFLNKIQKKAKPLLKVGISNKQAVRGNRENLKKQIASITIDKQAFDSKKWKEFLSKSDKLKDNDIETIENRNQYGKTEIYTIKLACLENVSSIKLQGFNYYFKHQEFVGLPKKDSQHKAEIIKKYNNFEKNWLTIKFLNGYKSSKWDQKTLIYKIRTDNISKKKTNFTNELFQGFHLIGILPKVREYIEQLEYEINNVPLDDVREQLFLEMSEDIRDALRGSKAVQKLIEDFIQEHAARYNDTCKIISIKFIQRSVKLNILLVPGKEKLYEKSVKEELESILTKQMSIRTVELDFDIDQQFLGKLEEDSIIVTSHKKNCFSYISKQSDFHENFQKIQLIKREFQEISQQELFVKGKAKLNKYIDQIKALKNNSKYEEIYITQPQSLDKINYRIAFVGPRKKNAEFIMLVNQRIAEIEKTLGTYYKLIDQQQTNFLVEDNEIQERILKNYNMSTVVDPKHLAEAILAIMPSQPNKKIYFFKSKNLSIIPINYKIFFIGAEQLQTFSEKYLDILKMKSKRLTKNDMIKEVEPNRRLQLYYKISINTQEMVYAALQSQESQHLACFILPKQQKQKFIKDLLTVLTYSKAYEQKKYSFIIINPNEDDDIKAIINLPEFQLNKKEELVIEWSCDGHPYSKSGNSKINDAISKGEQFCILTEDDLYNLRHRIGSTFICDLQRKSLTKGGDQLPLLFEKDCIKFIYKDAIYQLSAKQYNLIKTYLTTSTKKFYIPLAYYRIDLRSETQINIFTGRTRNLQKQQKLLQIQGEYNGKVHAFYERHTPALIFSFQQADSKKLSAAVTQIQTYLTSRIKTSMMKLKPISEKYRSEIRKMLKSKAEEYELRYQYNQQNNSVTLQSLNEKNISRCQTIIESEMDYLIMLEKMGSSQMVKEKREVKYPQDWRPQKDEIQTFVVNPFSQQFLNVQQLFTAKPITELIKIQNKYLFKKYSDELDHLTYLNKNKRPKEMMLFHGTKHTDPRVIWQDKEEGFNINYSADSNLLGRGIYFAEKSEYSMGYMHPESPLVCSMLLCKVIVGESQELKMTSANSQVKDTIIKDNATGVRYESMKGKHDICDIYVVYKDKRAYPAYLIKFKR